MTAVRSPLFLNFTLCWLRQFFAVAMIYLEIWGKSFSEWMRLMNLSSLLANTGYFWKAIIFLLVQRHYHRNILLIFRNTTQVATPGNNMHRTLQDSQIFIGGKQYLNWLPGSLSKQYFIGCLQQIYYNGVRCMSSMSPLVNCGLSDKKSTNEWIIQDFQRF